MAQFNTTQDLLETISTLRFCNKDLDTFWSEYLHSISFLTKSPIAIAIDIQNDEYQVLNRFISNSEDQYLEEKILDKAFEISNRAKSNIFAFEKFIDDKYSNYYIVAINLENDEEQKDTVLLILIDGSNKSEFNNIILRSSLCRDIPLQYFLFNDIEDKKESNIVISQDKDSAIVPELAFDTHSESFSDILSILNSINHEEKFKLSCMKLVDEISTRFDVIEVCLGWENNGYIKTVAIGKVETFQNSTHKVKSIEAIFEESYEQDEEIFYPEDKNSILITHSHDIYAKEYHLNSIYTFPIRLNNETIGILSIARKETPLEYEQLEVIRLTLNFLAPILNRVYESDKNIFQKALLNTKKVAKNFFGPKVFSFYY
jgi:hypothetical protein